MIQKGKNVSSEKNIDTWYNYIIQVFKERYEYLKDRDNEIWFICKDKLFHVCDFGDWFNGFIIEYANEATEKAMGMAVDGNQWPLLDYDTPEDMLQKMLVEIEG